MNLKILSFSLLFVIFSNAAQVCAEDQAPEKPTEKPDTIIQSITGTALKQNKEFFYTEQDDIQIKDNHIQKIDSLYKDKDSKLMVEMHCDFSKKPYLPDIHFQDHRKDTEFQMTYIEKENKVSISQNLADKKEMKSKNLNYDSDMINSMGLINYIRENFVALKKDSKSFHYVIPALMDDYGMLLTYRPNSSPTDTMVQFAFSIKSFFIRNISGIKESILTFDEKGLFIKAFNGVSNILDDSNHTVEVQITYSEPTTRTK